GEFDAARVGSSERRDVAAEVGEKVANVEGVEIGRLHQPLMHESKRIDAAVQIAQRVARLLIRSVQRLEIDQAVDHLKIVLHAMMYLAQQKVTLGDRLAQICGAVGNALLQHVARASKQSLLPHELAHEVKEENGAGKHPTQP